MTLTLRALFVTALVAACMSATAMIAVAAPNDGSVTGQVLNKTSGGGSTAGASVMLIAFGRKEQAPLGQKTAQADASGHYQFDGLDRDQNIVYLPAARFQNVT